MKVIEALSLFQVLNEASLQSMTRGCDKYAVIKALRALRAVAQPFIEFRDDAVKRLAGPQHEQMVRQEQEWQEALRSWEEGGREGAAPVLAEEARQYRDRFTGELNACLEEEAAREVEIELPVIGEEGMGGLLEGNPWTVPQAVLIDHWLGGDDR